MNPRHLHVRSVARIVTRSGALSRRLWLCVAGLWLAAAPAMVPAQEAPFLIGVTEPLTGVNAFYGQQARWGAALAIAQANAAGGIQGRQVAAEYVDNMCNPAEGVKSVSQMLASSKYIALLDGGCSSVALAVMPLAERAGIPYVVANPSAPAITERAGVGGNKWTFKVNPTDATMLKALGSWLVKNANADRVAVLAEDTDFGRGGAKALQETLSALGKTSVAPEFFQKGTSDFSAVFARIKAGKPTQLAIFAIGADTSNLLNQWYEAGGGAPLTGRVQLEQIPKALIRDPVFAGISTVQPWDLAVDDAANRKFVADFRALANSDPTVNAWNAYEATRTLIAALGKAGKSATPAQVRDALQGIRVPAMFGGTIEFDDHNLAHVNSVILTIADGKVVVVGMSKT